VWTTVLAQMDRRTDLSGLGTALLAVAIVLGSAVLWIGIPLLGLWLAGELTSSSEGFLFATLGGIPLAMVAFGWLLYRLNAVYVRSRGSQAPERRHSAWNVSLSDEGSGSRRARAPRPLIDIAMTVSLTIALVLMAVWFFFFSKMWLANPL
jgi:hypothetical protein